jgi:hypothetical protein
VEGSYCSLIRITVPEFACSDSGNPWEPPVSISNPRAKIWTSDNLNAKQEC